MIADSVQDFPIVKETVLCFWSHNQVNTTSIDLLHVDVEKNFPCFLSYSF